MGYYLLKVEQQGKQTYKEASAAKHMIDAPSLADAKPQADRIVDEQYAGGTAVTIRLFDETGLLATRNGVGGWES